MESERGPSARHDVLFHHDGPEIVGTVVEGELADFGALGDPRTLQVFDVVEEDAGECLHAEVLGGSDGFGFEDGVLRLERPADEGGEPSGAIL